MDFISTPIPDNLVNSNWERREGIEIEKGAALSEEFMIENEDLFKKYLRHFTVYPDLFLDLIKPVDSGFSLFFYQRLILRAIMRYTDIYIVAPRAAAKSFLTILALFLQCIFYPGTKRFICAPGKGQSAQIAKEKLIEIYHYFPLLKNEIKNVNDPDMPGNFGKDYVELRFKNGSRFDVTAPLDSTRGGRRHGGLIDETRDHAEKPLNEIVLPLMNVSRPLPSGEPNPKEPNQQVINMTSAGTKTSFAYSLLIDFFERSIIAPSSAFVMGFDFRLPVLHGLLTKDYVRKQQMAPSYNEESFLREYVSRWSGGSEESWFNFDKLQKYRRLKNPEQHAIYRGNDKQFYLLSVDVGRIHDQTVVTVFRVNPHASGRYVSSVVNIKVLGRDADSKTFSQQALDIKKIAEAFNPKEIVIDLNGLGVGLGDELIRSQFEGDKEYGPLGFHNDKEYKKVQPKGAPQILYGIKASQSLNSQIHNTAYSRINGGLVRFLIREQEARTHLLSTQTGRKMSFRDRTLRLMPHEMTSLLFQEMANLRLKPGSTQGGLIIEQINSRFPKDKYSSFSYGLWRIKELEEQEQQKRIRYGDLEDTRELVFYTGGV